MIVNRNRMAALVMWILTAIAGWYGLLLLTNPYDPSRWPTPTHNQLLGLLVAVVLAAGGWLKKCLTVLPY